MLKIRGMKMESDNKKRLQLLKFEINKPNWFKILNSFKDPKTGLFPEKLNNEIYVAFSPLSVFQNCPDNLLKIFEEENKKISIQNEELKKEKTDLFELMVEIFLDRFPLFYDKSKILWQWDTENFRWEIIDDIDLGNLISSARSQGVAVGSRLVNKILERSRLRIPKTPKDTWIQFKDQIYDFETGETFPATPEYFFTNPIPWGIGETEFTPNIDRFFSDWVGDNYIQTLHEIAAYCLTPNKFMQRLLALVGGGSNGKSTYISLLQKILTSKNYTSSELKILAERNFETAILYRKLLCIIGEVSYTDLSNTSQLKRLSGEDEIRFEFKCKQPFSDKNTATIICLTNSLPTTPDKSLGFYRRWLIVDFPNQFPVSENPIKKIEDWEIRNLCRKYLRVLKEIYQTRKFTNEGSYEERAERYEERSNPVLKFLETHCEEVERGYLPLRDFSNELNLFLKKSNMRLMSTRQISKILRDEGYNISPRKEDGHSTKCIINISLQDNKTIETTETTHVQLSPIGNETNKKYSSFGSFGNLEVEEAQEDDN